MKHTLTVFLPLVALACGGGRSGGDQAAPFRLEGRVALTGSVPAVMVTLQPPAGDAVALTGPLLDELRRLAGLVVTVEGEPAAGMPTQAVRVTRYEIVSAGGERPVVGVLVRRGETYWLQGDEALRLVDVPAGLRRRVGATIWVVGAPADDGLRPQSYGVIRDPA